MNESLWNTVIWPSWWGLLLFTVWLHISYGIVRRWGQGLRLSTRWACVGLVLLYMLTLLFHVLMELRAFRAMPAVALTIAAGILCHVLGWPLKEGMRCWFRDLQTFVVAVFRGGAPVIAACWGAMVLITLVISKTLLVPPLGWDAVSYHAAKAAMWVQHGRHETLIGPGGWSYFPLFPGGGDLLYALAMLPFRSDLLASAVGGLIWLAGGLATYALARTLRASRMGAGAAACLVLFTPAVHRLADSCYVEPILQLYTAVMAICAVLYFERDEPFYVVLALAGIGLMAAVKIMGVVVGAVAFLFLALRVILLRHRNKTAQWVGWIVGCVLASLVVAPWWARAIAATGRPLSPIPIRFLGWELGRINADLQWLRIRPLAVFSFEREWNTLKSLFIWSSETPSLGFAWAVFFALLLPACLWARKLRWHEAFYFTLALIGTFLIAYYHPDMLVLRTHWATSNARYWVQILPLAAALLAAGCEALPRGRLLWACAAWLASAGYAYREMFWGVSGVTLSALPWVVLVLIGGGVVGVLMVARGWYTAITVMGLVAVPVLLIRLADYRDTTRWDVYRDEGTKSYHHLLRYWGAAAEHLDRPGYSYRIAVTSAPWQNGDNWLVYPFLGRRFQNELLYVPISESGEVMPFDGTLRYLETSHPAAWVARLYQHGVTHVMSFWPPSVETYWMLQNRVFFKPITVSRKWGGCFELRPWSETRVLLERMTLEAPISTNLP